jgi:hypothetical protein
MTQNLNKEVKGGYICTYLFGIILMPHVDSDRCDIENAMSYHIQFIIKMKKCCIYLFYYFGVS